MADDTGGKYYYVSDPRDLEPALRAGLDDLRNAVPAGGTMLRIGRARERTSTLHTGFTVKLKDAGLAGRENRANRKSYYDDGGRRVQFTW